MDQKQSFEEWEKIFRSTESGNVALENLRHAMKPLWPDAYPFLEYEVLTACYNALIFDHVRDSRFNRNLVAKDIKENYKQYTYIISQLIDALGTDAFTYLNLLTQGMNDEIFRVTVPRKPVVTDFDLFLDTLKALRQGLINLAADDDLLEISSFSYGNIKYVGRLFLEESLPAEHRVDNYGLLIFELSVLFRYWTSNHRETLFSSPTDFRRFKKKGVPVSTKIGRPHSNIISEFCKATFKENKLSSSMVQERLKKFPKEIFLTTWRTKD